MKKTPYDLTITLDDRAVPATVYPLKDGFEVEVEIAGGAVRVYGDTEREAIDDAHKRLTEAALEFAGGTKTIRADVDGGEADVVLHANGAAPQLPLRTAGDCAAEVHRCQGELAKRTRTFEDAKSAMKAAESAVGLAFEALLEATDREAKPTLPLEPVAA